MRLPWADCPLTAIDLVDNIPDAGVPELDWLATNEGKIVKLVVSGGTHCPRGAANVLIWTSNSPS